MTAAYRKKLIEVALPLDAINKEAAREKSIRHGHPSTLHLWWARRPLAACRAVLFASLVDDPGNDLPEKEAAVERQRLFAIIEELVHWENSNDERVLHAARTEIARSVARAAGASLPAGKLTPAQVRQALAQYAPPVLDPFCGGGSIPLEAQRLGLKAYASDLNPVAVLITKALIEIPPKFAGRPPVHPRQDMELGVREWKGAAGLAEDVRYYGQWMRDEAEKRIGHLYPKGPNGETVIAWLWARTVKCPNPACGATMPLLRSYWLSRKRTRLTWVEPEFDEAKNSISFRIVTGSPTAQQVELISTGSGLRNDKGKNVKATFRCPICKTGIAKGEYVDQEADQGRLGVVPLALVVQSPNSRKYLPFDDNHTRVAIAEADRLLTTEPMLARIPAQPARGTFASNAQGRGYGFKTFGDYFTSRQLTTLITLTILLGDAQANVHADAVRMGLQDDGVPLSEGGRGARAYGEAVITYLAFAIDRTADRSSTLCSWDASPKMEALRNTFARHAIAMTWDFAEGNPFSTSSGNWSNNVEWAAMVVDSLALGQMGEVQQADARDLPYVKRSAVVCTDPPYYGNIGYADLSDYFYVWLRPSLSPIFPVELSTLLVPKKQELIAAPHRHDNDMGQASEYFEDGLRDTFGRLCQIQDMGFPVTLFYAFKQTESGEEEADDIGTPAASTGWETMLDSLIGTGFVVTGTWPTRSELGNRPVALGANALASSIVLVCRPRPDSASLATRREFVAALKKELPPAITKLTHGGIAPVDLAQASIGPGMAVFSRYAKVLEADGTPMSVRTALQIINQQLDEYLAAEEGDLDRDTRFAVAWFQQFGHSDGPFGEADVLARAKDTAVEGLVRAGILRSRAGKVRLLRRGELDADWDPRVDARLTVWECAQQLIRRLNETGEDGAARLLRQLGSGRSEDARALAYRLYAICERKGWAEEALAYNALVVSWPEIERKAAGMEGEPEQGRLL